MSIVASPTQQGVVQKPNAAHLRTNVINGKVRIASSTNATGGQPAVYHIVGGSITNNIKLSLPDVTADDTLAAQGGNNNWTGMHTFQQGLTSNGTISTAALNATALSSSGTINSTGDITTQGNVIVPGMINPPSVNLTTTIGSHVFIGGNITATNGTSSFSTLNVSATHTASGLINANGSVNVGTASAVTHNGTITRLYPTTIAYSLNGGMLSLANNNGNVNDSDYFGVFTGGTKGCVICTATTQRIGFFNTVPTGQNTGGARSVSGTWDSNAQYMVQTAYNALRNYGLLS